MLQNWQKNTKKLKKCFKSASFFLFFNKAPFLSLSRNIYWTRMCKMSGWIGSLVSPHYIIARIQYPTRYLWYWMRAIIYEHVHNSHWHRKLRIFPLEPFFITFADQLNFTKTFVDHFNASWHFAICGYECGPYYMSTCIFRTGISSRKYSLWCNFLIHLLTNSISPKHLWTISMHPYTFLFVVMNAGHIIWARAFWLFWNFLKRCK